jgi:hypothetical protein
MGTNYHYHVRGEAPGDEGRHIGKSSAGWCFALHVYPDEGIKTLEDWKKLFSALGSRIENENEAEVTVEDMLKIITDRARPQLSVGRRSKKLQAEWNKHNNAIDGPNGLRRADLEKDRVIGHGQGTWDYFVGEFS